MKSQRPLLPLTALAIVLAGCGDKPGEDDTAKRLVPVEALTIERSESYPIEEHFVATVEARRHSSLAFELGGTIETIAYEEGEAVREGDALATIDTSRLEARRAELTATLQQAEATRKLAQSTFSRYEALVATQSVSVQDLDNTRERLASADANLTRIRAQLDSVEVDLAKSVIRAPYDGTLSRRNSDEGSVVGPNQPILELLETGHLEARAAMTPDSLTGLKPGDLLPVRLGDGSEHRFPLLRLLPQRDDRTRTIDAILAVPDPAGLVRDGDLLTVQRDRQVEEPGFFLPRDALTESVRGLWACFVLVPDPEAGPEAHRLDRRDLEVLHSWSEAVYARGPVEPGALVLATGLQRLAPGQRVRIGTQRDAPSFPSIAADGTIRRDLTPRPASE